MPDAEHYTSFPACSHSQVVRLQVVTYICHGPSHPDAKGYLRRLDETHRA